MFTRCFIALITASLCFASCVQKKNHKDVSQQITVLNARIKDQNISKDSLLALYRAKIHLLEQEPDSLRSFVLFNLQLYDSARIWGNKDLQNESHENIIRHAAQVEKDSTLIDPLLDAYYKQGKYTFDFSYTDKSVNHFENFLALTQRTGCSNPPREYTAYLRLGILYNILGDLKNSMFCHNRAMQISVELKNNDDYATITSNIAIALNESGQYNETIHRIQQAIHLDAVEPERVALLSAYLATAQMQKGLPVEAEKNSKRACNIIDTFATAWEKRRNIYMSAAGIRLALKDSAAANSLYHKALFFEKQKMKEDKEPFSRYMGKCLVAIGKLEMEKNADTALSYFQKALRAIALVNSIDIFAFPQREQLYQENTFIEALDAKALALERKYSLHPDIELLKAAVTSYELSFEAETKLMSRFNYDESRMLMLKDSRARSERAIGLCWKLQEITKANNWAEKAFDFAERNKAIILLESVKRNIASGSLSKNDKMYKHMQEMQVRLAFFEKKVAEDTSRKLLAQKETLENNLLQERKLLAANNPSYREALEKTGLVSVAQARNELLDDHTLLVEFFYGDSDVYKISFSKKGKVEFAKAAEGIGQKIYAFQHFFADRNQIDNDPVAFQQAAYVVYDGLGFSAPGQHKQSRLLLIPDGPLNLLPFEALVTKKTASRNLGQLEYLLKEQEISYGYSAATLFTKLGQSTNASNDIAGFAPVFENRENGKRPLLSSRQELEAVQNEYSNGDYFFGKAAGIHAFRKMAGAAGILHIATHAYSDTAGHVSPHIEFFDSSLSLSEVYALQLNANLVVLSACETGIGRIEKSEGPMSLARGFYYAGAKNIIMGLWNADDAATTQLFKNFYAGIHKNNFATALRDAKLQYLQHSTATNASPYYWAGFTGIGYEKERNKSYYKWLTGAVSILILFALFLYLQKRRLARRKP